MFFEQPVAKKPKLAGGHQIGTEDPGSDAWDHDPQKVVRFRLIESMNAQEMKEEIAAGGIEFDAEFFHQHFGQDNEGETRIKGYKDLRINLWMSAQTYHTWLDIQYSKKRMGADKLEKVFKEGFPLGYVKSKTDFIQAVTSAVPSWPDLSTLGENMATVPLKGDAKVYIKRFNLADCPKPVQELHGRFEPLLLFYIDGAQIIEKGDPKWDVLMLIQPTPKGNQLLGLTTMYNFWAYPDNIRLRLSQILVLPPYQDAGLGKRMLQVTYDIARARNCIDLTIEDPTPNLQRVREKLEVDQLLSTPWAAQMAAECARAMVEGRLPSYDGNSSTDGSSASTAQEQQQQQQQQQQQPPHVAPRMFGAPSAFVSRAQQDLKIYKREARLVWESLLFMQPELWLRARGRSILEALVAARLEETNFSHCAQAAERKRLVQTSKEDERSFIVMRVKDATQAVESSDKGGEAGQCAHGRLNVVTVGAEEKAAKMAEMVEERVEQMAALKRLIDRGARAVKGAPQ